MKVFIGRWEAKINQSDRAKFEFSKWPDDVCETITNHAPSFVLSIPDNPVNTTHQTADCRQETPGPFNLS